MNAGARRVIFIMPKDNQLYLEAEASINSDKDSFDINILQSLPLQSWQDGPISIIQYVKRTREVVIRGSCDDE